jgi:hypothetical protein
MIKPLATDTTFIIGTLSELQKPRLQISVVSAIES